MTDTITMFDATPTHTQTAVVEFFDPPMCCPTGLCGPTLDQTLLDVNEMILDAAGGRFESGALSDDRPTAGVPEQP